MFWNFGHYVISYFEGYAFVSQEQEIAPKYLMINPQQTSKMQMLVSVMPFFCHDIIHITSYGYKL